MGEDAAEIRSDELSVNPEGLQELDPLPEHCQYQDEGCDLAGSCLNCPFDECVYARPGGKKRWLREERFAEMARLYVDEGKSIRELADLFGVSRRTVQRDLKASLQVNNRRK